MQAGECLGAACPTFALAKLIVQAPKAGGSLGLLYVVKSFMLLALNGGLLVNVQILPCEITLFNYVIDSD